MTRWIIRGIDTLILGVFCWFLFIPYAYATITRKALGTKNDKTKGLSTWTPLTAITVNSGDWLFVGIAFDAAIGSVIPTWNGINADGTTAGGYDVGLGSTNNCTLYRWSASAVGSGGTGDLVFPSLPNSPIAKAVFAVAVSGLAASALDVSSSGSGSSASPSDTGVNINQASEIFVGVLATAGPSTDASGTWSNSWSAGQRDGTTGGSSSSNETVQEGFKIVSVTESSQAALTGITSRGWNIAHATYKGSTSPPPATPHGLLTHGVGGMAQAHRQHINHYVCNLAPCGDMTFARMP